MDTPASVPGIQAETDLCVKCGLCLPHCPTWRIHRREGDSPRGRVELIAALAGGQVEPGPASQARLDGCLLCRACESVCPARVPFGHLMDQARERWPARGIWWSRLFCSAAGRVLLRFGFWLAAASGLARIGQPLLALLPEAVVLRRKRLSKTGSHEVGLFTGCVSDAVDRATLNDAATLLERCGARVAWIEGSGCCGALDRHQGNVANADAHVQGNAARIDLHVFDHLVSVATGCAAELMDYPQMLGGEGAAAWEDKHCEVMAYLASPSGKTFIPALAKGGHAASSLQCPQCAAGNHLGRVPAAKDPGSERDRIQGHPVLWRGRRDHVSYAANGPGLGGRPCRGIFTQRSGSPDNVQHWLRAAFARGVPCGWRERCRQTSRKLVA